MSEDDRSVPPSPVTSPTDAVAIVTHELEHDVADVRAAATTLAHLVSGRRDDVLASTCNRLVAAVTQTEQSLQRLVPDPQELDRLQVEPVRVSAVVRQVVTRHDPSGQITTRLSGVVAHLDPVRFERIVDNLVRNALQHTPPGCAISVSVTTVDESTVELTVRDDGPDRAHEQVAALLADETIGRTSWTGLGVVSHFVRLHGGTTTTGPGPSGTGLEVHVRLPQVTGTGREQLSALTHNIGG